MPVHPWFYKGIFIKYVGFSSSEVDFLAAFRWAARTMEAKKRLETFANRANLDTLEQQSAKETH